MPRKNPKHVEVSITRHGRRVVYFRKGRGPRVRLPDDMESTRFAIAYEAALNGRAMPHLRDIPPTPKMMRRQRTEKTLRGAIRSAKTRAKAKGVPFRLTLDFLLDMAERQDFRCAVTGIEFFAPAECKSRVHPYTPSIDRIKPELGYVPGNVRILAYAVNAMILDWGDDLFEQVTSSYRRWNQNKKSQPPPAPCEDGART